MLPFEEAQEELTRLADSIPPEIFRSLNGGVLLLPETKMHPKDMADNLYILGEYHVEPYGFGRYITLYYGSFERVHGHSSDRRMIQALREVLHHELTHHLESLAGDASLEYQDEDDIQRYLDKHDK